MNLENKTNYQLKMNYSVEIPRILKKMPRIQKLVENMINSIRIIVEEVQE